MRARRLTALVSRHWRREILGAGLWVALAGVCASGVSRLSLIDLLLALALLVAVPLARPLLVTPERAMKGRSGLAQPELGFEAFSALAGVAALLIGPGVLSGVLALPWLIVCVSVAYEVTRRWWAERRLAGADIARVLSGLYLVVGGTWFVISRLGWRPRSFPTVIVELTAVHFHYAGMTASLLGAETLARVGWPDQRATAAKLAVAAIVVSPPVVAAGFTYSPTLQTLGGSVLAAGLILLSGVTLFQVVPRLSAGPWRSLLTISAIAVVAPMILAVDWVLGQHAEIPALSIPQMAQVHGSLNALAFSVCGLLGWRLLADRSEVRDSARITA